jgi:membrane protein YqaA with SNARE-associated domain
MSEGAKLRLSQRISIVLLVAVLPIWLYDVVTMATGFRTMSLLRGLAAVMVFLPVPVLLWRWFSEARGEQT